MGGDPFLLRATVAPRFVSSRAVEDLPVNLQTKPTPPNVITPRRPLCVLRRSYKQGSLWSFSAGTWERQGLYLAALTKHGPGGRRGAAGAAASAPARQVPRGRSSQATRPREAAEHEKGPGTPPRTGRRSGRDEGERAVQTHARRAAPTGAEQGATGLCCGSASPAERRWVPGGEPARSRGGVSQ
ncbi:unnamed protein product [Prorocentrum cordatum]|uniref:Uncharacterized protein n=1 Tax=Prorocentrum cordatum TaxID=2364126 RepID=A0ABN9XHP7_9DINO|nr:unnamed protein product [Polarella glacialis]